MSRLRLYLRAIGTGYALLALNTIYQLALVPIALHYLGIELFGVWALCIQVGLVLQLADVGMLGALGRILINHKDDKTTTAFDDTFYTLWFLIAGIGALLALTLTLSSGWLCALLAIQTSASIYPPLFLAAYSVLYSIDFMLKPVGTLLFIQQRSDLANMAMSAGLVAGFLVVWMLLQSGWGIWALFAGNATTILLSHLLVLLQCLSRCFMPRWRGMASLGMAHMQEVFRYGKDRFAVTTGHILLQAAPGFLITRLLGLEIMAAWTIGTKMYQLCLQLIMRISDFSYPALAEMFVRNEFERLRFRFNQLFLLCGSLLVLAASLLANCNRHFVDLWTGGQIVWSYKLDALMGVLLLCHTLPRLFYVPASIATNIRNIRFAYLLEAGFVTGLLFAWPGNVTTSLIIIVLCAGSILFTLPAFTRKSAILLSLPRRELLAPLIGLFSRVLLPSALAGILLTRISTPATWPNLILLVVLTCILVAILLAFVPDVRTLVRDMMPGTAGTQKPAYHARRL